MFLPLQSPFISALNLLSDMEELNFDVKKMLPIYITILDALCKFDRVKDALRFLREMNEKGARLDVATYSALIRVLCTEGLYKEVSNLYNEICVLKCLNKPLLNLVYLRQKSPL